MLAALLVQSKPGRSRPKVKILSWNEAEPWRVFNMYADTVLDMPSDKRFILTQRLINRKNQ
jgi:hypothetical protein